MAEFLIYGANGYTGALIARLAVERGHRPVLAGRNAQALASLAGSLGLTPRVFSLDDTPALDDALGQSGGVVLHCAGPFAHTARPMIDACLRTRTHYLDVTGEISVFELAAHRDADARTAGVLLLPGVGFDVVPSDCLATHLKRRLPTATHLTLGFQSKGGLSRGTATTMAENLPFGGAIRRGGKIVRVPACWRTRTIDFGAGPVMAMTIPWGDVSTAWYSTGIPDIEVYLAAPPAQRVMARLSRYLGWLLAWRPVQRWLKARIQARPPGPSDEQRARGRSLLWGEARDDQGVTVVSRLRGPEGYTLTALTALAVVEQLARQAPPPGFQTPGRLFGPDFILTVPGIERTDDPPQTR
jgi:short subunit dehydrogenase-like uncharacterized protein